MTCGNCGAQISDDAYFCPECGMLIKKDGQPEPAAKQQETVSVSREDTIESSAADNGRRCPACGAETDGKAVFCSLCGQRLDVNLSAAPPQRRSGTKWYVVGIVVGVIALFFVTAFIAFSYFTGVFNLGDGADKSIVTAPLVTTNPPATDPPATSPPVTATPVQEQINRVDLYSSAYTYKRMDEIHGSVRASDALYLEIKNVIEDFDSCCESYMNEGDRRIFMYLAEGTTAYNQQTDYKKAHPTLRQTYDDVRVMDVREGSGYAYAWVSEVIDVTENGESRRDTDQWVYKLERNGNGWVVLDYTRDPAA